MRRILLAIAAALVLAGCGGDGPSKADAPDRSGNLNAALGFAPSGTTQLYFQDVEATDEAVGTVIEATLWEPDDVVWEAEFSGADVVALRDDVDFDALTGALEDCGFEATDGVYEIDAAKSVECGTPVTRALALDAERGVVIAGLSEERVRAALASDGDPDARLLAMTDALRDQQTLAVQVDADLCASVSGAALAGRNPTPEAVARAEKEIPKGQPFTAFGIGADGTKGRFVMRYASADAATGDVDLRAGVLRDGESIATGQPYSEIVTVDGARADGEYLIIDVSDPDGAPVRTLDMYQRADLAFARC